MNYIKQQVEALPESSKRKISHRFTTNDNCFRFSFDICLSEAKEWHHRHPLIFLCQIFHLLHTALFKQIHLYKTNKHKYLAAISSVTLEELAFYILSH